MVMHRDRLPQIRFEFKGTESTTMDQCMSNPAGTGIMSRRLSR